MRNIKTDRSRSVLAAILLVTAVIMLLSIIMNEGQTKKSELHQVEAESVQILENGGSVLSFDLEQNVGKQNTLAFHTYHQTVSVYSGEKELYSLEKADGIWGHTTGVVWNFVVIPEDIDSVTVKIEPCYPEVENYTCTFYLGLGRQIYTCLMKNSILAFIMSTIVISIGFYMLSYWFFIRKRSEIDETMFYLGIFSIILGLWSANETDAVQLIFENRIAASFLSFTLLMMMSIPFALFVRDFLNIVDQKVWRFICNLSLVQIFLSYVLHFTGIFEFRRSVIFTHMILAGSMFYLVGCIGYKIIKKQVDNSLKISIIGLGFLILAAVADLVSYYFFQGDSDIYGLISFLLFILILGAESAKKSVTIMEKGRRAKELEHFALTDSMTGFYNRNAYSQFIKSETAPYNYMVVTFDINNLKMCNDAYGHRTGDCYITKMAEIIEATFDKYGKCYRIGGDEFCCIISEAAGCPIDRLLQKMNQDITILNNIKAFPVKIGISSGYAVCKLGDYDIEKVRERADVMMYQNKKELKRM